MDTLRRLVTTPPPRLIRGWHLELLTLAALGGGVFGLVTGAY